jgi:hypothetical protein
MRHPSFVLQLPVSVWKPRLMATVILFTAAGAQEIGLPSFTIKPASVGVSNTPVWDSLSPRLIRYKTSTTDNEPYANSRTNRVKNSSHPSCVRFCSAVCFRTRVGISLAASYARTGMPTCSLCRIDTNRGGLRTLTSNGHEQLT